MTPRNVDRIGVGLAALGRPAYLTSGRGEDFGSERSVVEMANRTAEVLDAAYSYGIRYVDTARSYGRAEEFLAGWLDARPEITDMFVASKWGYRYVGDWRLDADVHEVKDHALATFESQLALSRGFLGNRLGLYQVHSVTEDSPVLSDAGLRSALAELRDSGIAVGLSTSGPRQADAIRAALQLQVGGAPLFSSVQSTWNLLETSATSALAEAHAAGVAVVVKECFANGRLAPGSSDPSPGVQRAAWVAAEHGVGLDQLAIGVVVQQPWVSRVLTGAVTPAQVRSHVLGAEIDLPPRVHAELTDVCEDPIDYWVTRSQRSWT